MNKFLSLIVACLFFATSLSAQSKNVYNWYKPGLSIRDKPGVQGTVITKVGYGEKLLLVNPFADTVSVVNEGMTGYWNLVEYKGKKGYVVGIYLLEMAPPKATVKTVKDYFAQISQPAGQAVTTKYGTEGNEMYSQYKKQLYKNGCEYHEAGFYESGYNTYFIPEMNLQQGFLLVRLIPEFKDVFTAADSYPTENKTIKLTQPYEREKRIRVLRPDGQNWTEKISVEYEEGAFYTFEMFFLSGQLVISFGGGV